MNISKEQLDNFTELPNYADIESIGFWEVVHTTEDIHCLCSIVDDPVTEEEVILLFHDHPELCGQEVFDPYDKKTYTIPFRAGSLMEGFRYWYRIGRSKSGYLSVHNAATYDKPIVEKVVPKCLIPDEKWEDTFILSKIQHFDRSCPKGARSPHGLQAYALRQGIHKPEITDFSVMDALMLHRVVEDCKSQKFASKYLKKERELLLSTIDINFEESYTMEWDYAKTCQQQEVYGALADRKHMEHCVEVWDKRLDYLESIIEPVLPPTVKAGTSTKITRKEMAVLMGYPEKITSRIPEPTEIKKQNGEDVEVPIKPYYKPTTNWTVVRKTNNYSGMHIVHGFSPSYIKKKELTGWIKTNHPDTKPKDWDIEKVVVEAPLLNTHTCKYFNVSPEDVTLIGGAFTKVKFETSRLTQHEQVKGYLIKSGIKWAEEWNFKKDVNGIVKASEDMVVSYPTKASYENQLHYTVKKGEAVVTSPKFGEKEYEQLETETGKQVGEYNTTMHRRRFLLNPKDPEEKGLLANIREDGRLPCGVNNSSTGTLRSSHRIWVNAPGAGSLYGEEIRRCIVASEGKKLVSSDMNSAQLSIAAYYANNYEYFQSVCYGQEFKVDDKGNEILHPDTGEPWYIGESGHCANSRAFELISNSEWKEAIETQNQTLIHDLGLRRKKSKRGTFGTLFGCSGKKLALMLDIEEHKGNEKKNAFLQNIGLDRPITILEKMCERNKRGRGGYIELPFGYYTFCSSPHARFNYLDQGTEAVCQKWAELYFDKESKKTGLVEYAQRILSYHKQYCGFIQ